MNIMEGPRSACAKDFDTTFALRRVGASCSRLTSEMLASLLLLLSGLVFLVTAFATRLLWVIHSTHARSGKPQLRAANAPATLAVFLGSGELFLVSHSMCE